MTLEIVIHFIIIIFNNYVYYFLIGYRDGVIL